MLGLVQPFGGLLTGKYNNGIPEDSRLNIPGFEWLKDKTYMQDKLEKAKKFDALAKEMSVSAASLAIAWCIQNPNVSTAILGATKKEQLLDNLKAVEVMNQLQPGHLQQIEEIFKTKPALSDY
jgi:aryl-alcohol dehydrogenase-like predicted oxidoreductase